MNRTILHRVLNAPADPHRVLSDAILDLESRAPDIDWARVAAHPPGAETADLAALYKEILKADPCPEQAAAFYVGMFDGAPEDESDHDESVITMYLAAAEEYDEEDEDFDWAVRPLWLPDEGYCRPDSLIFLEQALRPHLENSIGGISIRSLYEDLVLATVAVLHRDAFAMLADSPSLTGPNGSRPVAVGFDSGGAEWIGTITRDGWVPPARSCR